MTAVARPVWVPRGQPVRNFVVACVGIAAVAVALGWSGAARPRLTETVMSGQANSATNRFSYTVVVRNDGPLAIEITGFTGQSVDIDAGFRPVTIGGGDSVEVAVSGRVRCTPTPAGTVDSNPSLGLRVRPPLGPTRTRSGLLAGFLQAACNDDQPPPVGPGPPPRPHQPNGDPEG